MDTLILFLLALGLAMDCFTIAITNSSVSGLVKPGVPLKTAIAFTFAHVVLAFAGYWLGGALQSMFAGQENLIAFIIFGIIGSKMIMEARRKHPKTKIFDINEARVIIVLSLATAMDALLVGLAIGITGLNIYLAGVMIALTVFILTLGGMAGGKNLGVDFARRTAYFGGAFILIAAAIMLMQFL
ncbi:MAG: manganese efflux pump MntP family protein [Bacteroidales bacterium]